MPSSDSHARIHLTIVGRVQGVFFRASTVAQADRLGLTGWVRNCRDGSVEAMAEGPRDKLQAFADWCRRGPAGAVVDQVSIEWQQPRREFNDFVIKR